jgi:hypothetical protein
MPPRKTIRQREKKPSSNSTLIILFQRLAKIERDFKLANPEQEIQRQIDHMTSRIRTAEALLGKDEK